MLVNLVKYFTFEKKMGKSVFYNILILTLKYNDVKKTFNKDGLTKLF